MRPDCDIRTNNNILYDSIKAHRVILAACSPLFRTLFSHANDQKQILLYLKDVRLKELEALLDFMYNGEVSVDQVNILF